MPKRIALITTSYPRSPADFSGHFVRTEALRLLSEGHAVTVFGAGTGLPTNGPPRVIWRWDGGATGAPGVSTRLRQRPWRAFGLAAWLLAARRELEREGPFDRIVAHFLLPVLLPLLGASVRQSEVEVVVHGSDLRLLARLPPPLARSMVSRLLARGVRFRCVSAELLALLEDVAGAAVGERAYVEPAALDVSPAPSRAAARAALGFTTEQPLIVVVGRLIASKRVGVALRAARLIPNAALLVVGDGPELPALRRDFPEAHFLGAVSHPLALRAIAAADVLVSASKLEGAPTAVREARALSIPVVASAAGDLAAWAEQDSGLWVVH